MVFEVVSSGCLDEGPHSSFMHCEAGTGASLEYNCHSKVNMWLRCSRGGSFTELNGSFKLVVNTDKVGSEGMSCFWLEPATIKCRL